eukprot:6626541-Alexandrium_andersonii.AAC.1
MSPTPLGRRWRRECAKSGRTILRGASLRFGSSLFDASRESLASSITLDPKPSGRVRAVPNRVRRPYDSGCHALMVLGELWLLYLFANPKPRGRVGPPLFCLKLPYDSGRPNSSRENSSFLFTLDLVSGRSNYFTYFVTSKSH